MTWELLFVATYTYAAAATMWMTADAIMDINETDKLDGEGWCSVLIAGAFWPVIFALEVYYSWSEK